MRGIEEDLEESITPEVAGQFDLMRGRVSCMEAMIKADLQYSRIDRTETQLETVDVGALLTEVIDFLSPLTRLATCIDDEMPTLHALRLRPFQVFQKLLVNGIKHHNKSSGTIHVGARVTGEWVEFSVTDDRTGLPQSSGSAFGLSFRLWKCGTKLRGLGLVWRW